ncbi:hypothetical protein PQ455_11690 [Sphingomonas naphthae]|uniref:Uncharacterized protein n=1 Tax=Sphingomonas naphthae TaxID=1813468 RepID=A0ABY7TJ03_9SPHN|nr:hypothetical protein [Sphingomonas naphthae]WCT72299.1 hypothetical protein PQ455_11690 [Sphingomonas naphthae]
MNDDHAVSPATRAQRTMLAYGQCVVKRYRGFAKAYIETPPYMLGEKKQARALATNECLGNGGLKMSFGLFRGSLYEAFLVSQPGLLLTPEIASVPPIDYRNPVPVDAPAAWFQHVALVEIADCAIRANPGTASELFTTMAGSPEEAGIYRILSPSLDSCMSDREKITFSKIALRGVLAEAAYKLSTRRAKLAAVRT